jgi:hypothetical protein
MNKKDNTLIILEVLCMLTAPCSIVLLKSDGTRWRTGGEVKGKLANGMGSQYSRTTSDYGVSSITNADAHILAASSRLNWRPRRFKWTLPFRWKRKSDFCACTITFQTQSTSYDWTQITCVDIVALLLLSQRRTVCVFSVATKRKFLANGYENINTILCFV